MLCLYVNLRPDLGLEWRSSLPLMNIYFLSFQVYPGGEGEARLQRGAGAGHVFLAQKRPGPRPAGPG